MNKTKTIAVVFFIIMSIPILYYGGMFRSSEQKELESKWKPQQLPDLTFQNINGSTFKLSDYKDRVILLNFWASWCTPCITEFPSMVKLVKENKGKVVLIAISHDNSRADINKFLSVHSSKIAHNKDPDIIIAWDKNQKIARENFSVIKLPETIIVDKNTRMVSKIVGAVDWYGSKMRNDIHKLVNE